MIRLSKLLLITERLSTNRTTSEKGHYMTAGILGLSTGVPAFPRNWLIYHQSPLLEDHPQASSATVNTVLSHDRESPLHTATRLSNVTEVRRIIARPCNINAEDAAGWTALHMASYLGHLPLIQILLAAGASVGRIEHEDGFAALHLAIMPGNAECVKALLGMNAGPNSTTTSRCLTQAYEVETFRWSTETVFYSRWLALAGSLFKLG